MIPISFKRGMKNDRLVATIREYNGKPAYYRAKRVSRDNALYNDPDIRAIYAKEGAAKATKALMVKRSISLAMAWEIIKKARE